MLTTCNLRVGATARTGRTLTGENLLNGDYLRVSVWEDDAFSDDFINSFEVLVVDGIEAWKDGVAYTAVGDDGTDSMEFTFEAL